MGLEHFLDGETYEENNFKLLREDGGSLRGNSFISCSFRGCNLREVVFEDCSFEDCDFRDCDLSLSSFPRSRFEECRFEKCKLVGVNWSLCDQQEGRLLKKKMFDFSDCLLNHGAFPMMDLSKSSLRGSVAQNLNLEETNLSGADLCFCDLEGARFIHTNLKGADLRGASSYNIPVFLNTLEKTRFSLPEAAALLNGLDILLEDPPNREEA